MNLSDSGRHVTSVNQGLFSTTMEAEKRDPGNEVALVIGDFLTTGLAFYLLTPSGNALYKWTGHRIRNPSNVMYPFLRTIDNFYGGR